jgi:excisionase family DNA binding protein
MIVLLTTRTKPHPAMPDLTDYMTTEEAAKALGFHIVHIRRMLREKDLEGKKVGQMWFVHKRSVSDYKKRTEGLEKFDPRRGNQ